MISYGLVKRVFKSKSVNYWCSLIFGAVAVIVCLLWLYGAVNISWLYKNGFWIPKVDTTYKSVSFLAVQSGMALVGALAFIPMAIGCVMYYVWHLSDRIRKLERTLEELKKNV